MKTKLPLPSNTDKKVHGLGQIQSMMSQAIMRPLDGNNTMQKTQADGSKTADFAAQFIKPNKRLTSLERLQIYNQQYWLRLIECLEEDFRGVQSLLGRKKFHALAIGYLQTYPSRSFSLNLLGSKLPDFLLKEPYWGEQNQELLLDVARFEWAQIFALDAEEKPPLRATAITCDEPMQLILTLQPHLVLLKLNYPADTFVGRIERSHIGHSEAYVSNKQRRATIAKPTTPKPKKIYLAVFRSDNSIYSQRLEPAAFALLQLLKDGMPLGEACSIGLASQLNGKNAAKLRFQLADWFRVWTELKWFCT